MRATVLYLLLLLAAIAGFFVINHFGQYLPAPEPTVPSAKDAPGHAGHHVLIHVLAMLAAVVALGWVLGGLLRYLGQPPVIGEVLAGIVLGPSVLGSEYAEMLLPASAADYLNVIAQLGVILYMFLIGLELNPGHLKGRGGATVFIAHASILLPFVLGAALALWLYPRLSSSDVPFLNFALFFGVAMAITAMPVLARILSDLELQTSPLGVLALACAAVCDATAWCLLAVVVGIVQATMHGALAMLAWTVLYVGAMLLIARPMAARLLAFAEKGDYKRSATALLFVALLLSALATEAIGLHAIFGAFLLGAIIPHDSAPAREFVHKLEDTVTVLLLPAFFAFTGMRTQIGLVSSVEEWLFCGAIIAVATVGKFGGATLSARFTGLDWRASCQLGALMNTRGLMELIVLNVGLDLKIISPQLFAMMVLMALVTTVATTPILRALGIRAGKENDE